MACAMCHPFGSDNHPYEFPKFQEQINKFATLRDMINWCIEKPNEGVKIDPDGDAMKALRRTSTGPTSARSSIPAATRTSSVGDEPAPRLTAATAVQAPASLRGASGRGAGRGGRDSVRLRALRVHGE